MHELVSQIYLPVRVARRTLNVITATLSKTIERKVKTKINDFILFESIIFILFLISCYFQNRFFLYFFFINMNLIYFKKVRLAYILNFKAYIFRVTKKK